MVWDCAWETIAFGPFKLPTDAGGSDDRWLGANTTKKPSDGSLTIPLRRLTKNVIAPKKIAVTPKEDADVTEKADDFEKEPLNA